MKFILSTWFLFCFAISIAVSGNVYADISLYKGWLEEPPSAENRKKIFHLAKEISIVDPTLSNEIIHVLMKRKDVRENDSLFIHCLMLKAENHLIKNESDQADKQLKQALRLAEKNNNLDLQIEVLYQLGENQTQYGQNDKAWLFYQTATKILPKNRFNTLVIKILLGQSVCRLNENDLVESKAYADSALSFSKKLNNKLLISESFLQLAEIAQTDKDIPLEKTLLDQAWTAIQPDVSSAIAINILINQQKCALQLGDTLSANAYLAQAIVLQAQAYKIKTATKNQNQLEILDNYDNSTSTYFWPIVFVILAILSIFGLISLLRRLDRQKVVAKSRLLMLEEKEKDLDTEIVDFDQAVEEELKQTVEKCETEIQERQLNYPKLEVALEFSKQADYLKDLFLAKLSHEVRSPLTTILGFSSLLETELAMMEQAELFDFASNITQSGQSLIELLDNIFDLSLINSNKLELKISTIEIGALTKELISKYENQASQKGVRIVVSPSENTKIESDKGLVKRALSMVIDNAVRFTEKGYIKIDVQENKDKKLVCIQIKDTGIGIDKTYLKDVFEPYRKEKLGYSTLYQGTGLSLPLAKKIVAILGGSLEIDSEKGIGTTVTLNIPTTYSFVQPNNGIESSLPEPLVKEDIKLKKILLIEPDELNQLIVEKLLRKTYHVVAVENKKLASSYIKDLFAKNQQVDLFMIDIPAKDYTKAIQDLLQLKGIDPIYANTPAIGLVSQSHTEDTAHLTAHGYNALIAKPILRDQLKNAVSTVFEQWS